MNDDSLTIKRLTNLKEKLEQELKTSVDRLIIKFQEETKIKIGYINIDLVDVSTMDQPKSIVSIIQVNLSL